MNKLYRIISWKLGDLSEAATNQIFVYDEISNYTTTTFCTFFRNKQDGVIDSYDYCKGVDYRLFSSDSQGFINIYYE